MSCADPRAASPRPSTPTPRASRASSTYGRADELRAALGEDALFDVAVAHWGVTPGGNFEGSSILVRAGSDDDPPALPRDQAAPDGRARSARPARARRQAPHVVEFADARRAGRGRRRAGARRLPRRRARLRGLPAEGAAPPTTTAVCCEPGRTAARTFAGYLEDHAYLLEALLTLYEATFEARWFAEARALADTTIAHFADDERGGFFSTADDHERLVARRKDLEDAPIPSGNSSMALGLLRLARSDRRRDVRGAGARARSRCCTRSPPAIRSRSRTCCGRSTSCWPTTCARSRSSATGRRGSARCGWCATRSAHTWCWPAGTDDDQAVPLLAGRRPGRRPRRGVRVRALRLPGAGDGSRGARRAARLTADVYWSGPSRAVISAGRRLPSWPCPPLPSRRHRRFRPGGLLRRRAVVERQRRRRHGRHVRAPRDPVGAGALRRRARPSEDQGRHAALREDGGKGRLPLLRERRDRS